MSRYTTIYDLIGKMERTLAYWPELAALFARCYPNTLETTVDLDDGMAFIVAWGEAMARKA